MELILGTVQFGLPYGIAGRGARVTDAETRSILQTAWQVGIRWLDTAPAYGDIEARLDGLCRGLDFRVVTKLGGMPGETGLDEQKVAASLARSWQRLGSRLAGVLFHRTADLHGDSGQRCWHAARQWTTDHGVKLGCSGYEAQEIAMLHRQHGLDFIQLPGNAWDQRVLDCPIGTSEVHLRSCFLQGLLLMPFEQAAVRLPAAVPALRRWHAWLCHRALSPVSGALSVVKAFSGVTHCLVGVEDTAQMAEIAQAWHDSPPIEARELQEADLSLIDPRQWKLS